MLELVIEGKCQSWQQELIVLEFDVEGGYRNWSQEVVVEAAIVVNSSCCWKLVII